MLYVRVVILALSLVLSGNPELVRHNLPVVAANDNRDPAGTLRDHVLTISLEAKLAMWHPDGDSLPGLPIEVFAESGKAPSAPGPLLRVTSGTQIRVAIRNSLDRDTITFYVPANVAGAAKGTALDSVVVPPGAVGALRISAMRPGNYVYRANARTPIDQVFRMRGLLAGALIVDSAGGRSRDDRVFVILDAVDSVTSLGLPVNRRQILAINGRAWPHTERIDATVGDSLRWRVLNGSPSVHPMHLHGVYFRVHDFDGPAPLTESQQADGRMVVTERMTPFTTMSMSWVPERGGNWLFHCHLQMHVVPHRPLGATARTVASGIHENHARTAMGGLVLGVYVKTRTLQSAGEPTQPRRRLRLVGVRDPGFPDSLPSMRFVLEEPESGRVFRTRTGISPTIDLVRGEPVSIVVVNQLGEPASVHWHGIELDSYYDGVAGFSGDTRKLAPLIAPGDSFEARFTPPRSGTFMYHSHVEEERHHRAGLAGGLIVSDRAPVRPMEEHLFLIKSARGTTAVVPMEINGDVDPDTVVLRVGHKYRLRFIGLTVGSPNSVVSLTARPDSSSANLRDTMLVRWRPLAKDGADLPAHEQTARLAQQVISVGETHDFEFQPSVRGVLRIEVRPPAVGRLTVRVPIRIE